MLPWVVVVPTASWLLSAAERIEVTKAPNGDEVSASRSYALGEAAVSAAVTVLSPRNEVAPVVTALA